MEENNSQKETLLGMFAEYNENAKISHKPDISYDPAKPLALSEIRALDEKFILQTYARMPITFAYGSGEFLYDIDGTEYLDFLSGIAVTGLGHANADLIGTLNSQADQLWHTSNLFFNQQQSLLARALVEISMPGKVFFCSTGTEANETAFKLMRAHGVNKVGNPKKIKVIALENGFHGRTFASMSLTGQDKIHSGFGPIVPEIVYVPPNDIEALENAMDENTCGVIMELIQGEIGVVPMEQEYVAKARELCDKHNALLVFDEIQTGMGRTGFYFAWQAYGIKPDVFTMAKGLGGGFPIGAVLVAESFTDIFEPGMHGSTFGGNHLACAVGYEVIRTMENQHVLENVQKASIYLFQKLNALKKELPQVIMQIRGMGLLIGVVLNENIEARPLVGKMLDQKMVVGRGGVNVLRLAPPLIVRETTIDRAIDALKNVLMQFA